MAKTFGSFSASFDKKYKGDAYKFGIEPNNK